MSKTVKYAERAVTLAAQGAWSVFEKLNSIRPNRFLHAEMVRQATAEVVAEGEAAARLAAHHGLALSQVRARDPPADHRRQAAARDPAE